MELSKLTIAEAAASTNIWFKVERIVQQAQAGMYQKELKNSPEWEGLSWERRGEE